MRQSPTPSQRHQLWFTIGSITAVLAFVTTCGALPQMWEWFGVSLLSFHFGDLHAVLAASDAHAMGLNPYAIPSPFDPLGRPHVYGPWWLWMHVLGLTRADVFWLGAGLCVATVITLAVVLRPATGRQALAAILLLASPPLLLSYERGNNDLVVVLSLVLAGVAGVGSWGAMLQGLVIWAAAILKLYPIAALPLLAVGRDWRRAVLGVAGTLFLTALAVWIWRADFRTVIDLVPRPNTFYGFGLKVIVALWSMFDTKARATFALGFVVALAVTVWSGSWKRSAREEMVRGNTAGWFVAGGATWVFCFLTNANFPYRVALLALVAAAWFRMWRHGGEHASAGRGLVLLLLTMTWLRFVRIVLVFVVGTHERLTGLFTYGLEHGFACGLSAIIFWSLVDWSHQILARWWEARRQAATA